VRVHEDDARSSQVAATRLFSEARLIATATYKTVVRREIALSFIYPIDLGKMVSNNVTALT